MVERIIIIVMDSVGIGALPDAGKFGDADSNTLGHIAEYVNGLNVKNFQRLGLGNIAKIKGILPCAHPIASFGKMAELSSGMDTITGHWEMMGIISKEPLPTYPDGFPEEIVKEFERRIGRQILGNKTSSGTKIIEELGMIHIETGYPIIYTSADSVFQIAAHEEIIPVEQLYGFCEVARGLLTGPHAVGRVIARPFIGRLGSFKRTDRRKDFSLKPPSRSVLNYVKDANMHVIAIGKIYDIFGGEGITEKVYTKNNIDGVDKTIQYLSKDFPGIIFTNLVDFDMLYGHRNDPEGYAKAFEMFDDRLDEILPIINDSDVLIITADHGCDPTTESTDHSREYVPLLVYNPLFKSSNLGIRKSFVDIGATICDFLNLETPKAGISFKNLLKLTSPS